MGAGARTSGLWLSVITVMEVEVGVARIERRDERRGVELRRWSDRDLLPAFEGRLLPIDVAVARRAAGLHVPDPRSERDVLIAATALDEGVTVETRNISGLASSGVELLDPCRPDAARPCYLEVLTFVRADPQLQDDLAGTDGHVRSLGARDGHRSPE